MILALDPGLRACGCSRFTLDGQLHSAAFVKAWPEDMSEPDAWLVMAREVWRWAETERIERVVFEQPGFRRGDGKQNQAAREALVAVSAAVAARFFARATRVFPYEWEGTLKRPKNLRTVDPIIQRVRSRLSAEELQRIDLPAPSLCHNVWDSIGIGLWYFGRLDRKRYYGKGLQDAKT